MDNENIVKNIRTYLIDEGYKETMPPNEPIGYKRFEGSLLFIKPNNLPIHLCINKNSEIYTLSKLIGFKWKRGYESDLKQLTKIIENTKSCKDERIYI